MAFVTVLAAAATVAFIVQCISPRIVRDIGGTERAEQAMKAEAVASQAAAVVELAANERESVKDTGWKEAPSGEGVASTDAATGKAVSAEASQMSFPEQQPESLESTKAEVLQRIRQWPGHKVVLGLPCAFLTLKAQRLKDLIDQAKTSLFFKTLLPTSASHQLLSSAESEESFHLCFPKYTADGKDYITAPDLVKQCRLNAREQKRNAAWLVAQFGSKKKHLDFRRYTKMMRLLVEAANTLSDQTVRWNADESL